MDVGGLVIRPAALRQDWPWVKPLLDSVIAKTGEAWWPEDVYAAVSSGKAAMWVSDSPEGVLVAYPEKEGWSGETVLHVWVCACESMSGIVCEAYKVLTDAALKVGAKKLVMESPRKGWQREGWNVQRYIYERSL